MSTFGDGGHYSAYNNHINSMGYPSWRWKITGIERSRKWHKWSDVCMRSQEHSPQNLEQINSPLNFENVYLLVFVCLFIFKYNRYISLSGSRLAAYLIPIPFCCWSDLSKEWFLLKTLKLFPLTLRIMLKLFCMVFKALPILILTYIFNLFFHSVFILHQWTLSLYY